MFPLESPYSAGAKCFHETLQTERLRLRAYTSADEADLFDVFADPYARRFYPEMEDRAKVRAWIEWNLRNYDEFGLGLWAMELKADGRLIGDCGPTFQEVEGRRELEIGYHLIECERGKGYATEAGRICLDFGLTRTSCESDLLHCSNLEHRVLCRGGPPSHRQTGVYQGRSGSTALPYDPPGLGRTPNELLSRRADPMTPTSELAGAYQPKVIVAVA